MTMVLMIRVVITKEIRRNCDEWRQNMKVKVALKVKVKI